MTLLLERKETKESENQIGKFDMVWRLWSW